MRGRDDKNEAGSSRAGGREASEVWPERPGPKAQERDDKNEAGSSRAGGREASEVWPERPGPQAQERKSRWAIVGGGMLGLTLALRLREQGKDDRAERASIVTLGILVDDRRRPCWTGTTT